MTFLNNQDPPVELGVFQAFYKLEKQGRLSDSEMLLFVEVERWFDEHLKRPTRFARGKGTGRREGISWFKPSAGEAIDRMRQLMALLETKDVRTRMISTDRPGMVVYEDDIQVVAVPFRDRDF